MKETQRKVFCLFAGSAKRSSTETASSGSHSESREGFEGEVQTLPQRRRESEQDDERSENQVGID